MRYSQACKQLLMLTVAGLLVSLTCFSQFSVFAAEKAGEQPKPAESENTGSLTNKSESKMSAVLHADASEVISKEESDAVNAEQTAALIENGGSLTLNKAFLTKTGDSQDDARLGYNAILHAKDKNSKAYLVNSKLSADSLNSAGLFSTEQAQIYANKTTISTTADQSAALYASKEGQILVNKLTVATQGKDSAGITADLGGQISATNSVLSTSGSQSPLLSSKGQLEVKNITGSAGTSPIASLIGSGNLLIQDSDLTNSTDDRSADTADQEIPSPISIYSEDAYQDEENRPTASLNISNSNISSAISSGDLIYLTNTQANITLNNNQLTYNNAKVNLLKLAGNNKNMGLAGSNGAQANLLCLNQDLKGDIEVDSISSLNLTLKEKSIYTGKTKISLNAVNTNPSDNPITVNISKNSKWIMTADSTISQLNMEKGAKILDKNGKKVNISLAGQNLVKGNSKYTLTVQESYSPSIPEQAVEEDKVMIDRNDFDNYFKTSTNFAH